MQPAARVVRLAEVGMGGCIRITMSICPLVRPSVCPCVRILSGLYPLISSTFCNQNVCVCVGGGGGGGVWGEMVCCL